MFNHQLFQESSRSKIIKVEKSLKEILLESQIIYQNIFKALSKEYLNGIKEDYKKDFIENSKKIWLNYISKEYDIQNIYGTSTGKKRNPNLKNVIRSRQNTFDEVDNKTNINEVKKNKKKKQITFTFIYKFFIKYFY